MTRAAKWSALVAICLVATACAGMTAAEVGGAALSGTGAFISFIDALKPMLSPEQQAQLTVLAGEVTTIAQATARAVGAMAQSIAEIRASAAVDASHQFSPGEITAIGGGLTAGGVAVSRMLSAAKHREKPVKAPA